MGDNRLPTVEQAFHNRSKRADGGSYVQLHGLGR